MKKALITLSLASTLIFSATGYATEESAKKNCSQSLSFTEAVKKLQSSGAFSVGFRTQRDAEAAAKALRLSKYAIQKKNDIEYNLIFSEQDFETPASQKKCKYGPNGHCE